MADAVDDACIGSSGVIGGNVQHVGVVSCLLANCLNVVGVGEGVLGAGQTLSFQQLCNCVYLVLRVCFCGAVQQTNGLSIGTPFHNHFCLLVQRSQVGGTGNVGANQTVEAVDAQRHAVFGNGGAQNGDGAGCYGSSLQRGSCVCHNQINVCGNEAVNDGVAGVGIACCVLDIPVDVFFAQFSVQCIHKALGCCVQRNVLNQLAYANVISRTGIGAAAVSAAASDQTDHHQNCHCECDKLFHFSYLLTNYLLGLSV